MEDVSKLKVGVLRDRLAALGEDSSGVKKVLVERLTQALAAGGAAGATAAAPMVLDDDDDLNPSKMKVGELRDELAKRGADSSGTKPVLVARLEGLLSAPAAAGKRPASPPAAAADPAAKKPKGKQKAIVAKWFWAGDAKWNPYDGDQIEKLEAALEAGDGKCDVSADHFVDLSSSGRAGATGKTYVQRRAADPTRSRIVVRQSDGLDPAIPIPQVVGAPKTATIAKSGVIPAAGPTPSEGNRRVTGDAAQAADRELIDEAKHERRSISDDEVFGALRTLLGESITLGDMATAGFDPKELMASGIVTDLSQLLGAGYSPMVLFEQELANLEQLKKAGKPPLPVKEPKDPVGPGAYELPDPRKRSLPWPKAARDTVEIDKDLKPGPQSYNQQHHSIGMRMMKAKRSSMKVLSALYMKNLKLRCATDLRR